MNEGTKTGLFWVVAAVMVAIASFVAWPRGGEETQTASLVGRELFEDFKDPLAAASMKIVTFDATLGELESFEVAKDRGTGVWSIPSRQGYPADGSEQMRQAATALLGLKVLDVKSELPEDHDDYGVIEPDVEKLAVGDDGVGRMVTIKDENGDNLVSLVIGTTVKDNPTHRYVRIPTQDVVYEVELDESPLTTQFSAWIEDDLLQLSSIDIAGTSIRKYSVGVNATLDGRIAVDQQRSYDADLSIDDTSQWSLDRLVVYDETNTGSDRSLTESESLNTTTLNAMKNALDDLKIVDVKRKPDGMSADLKADKSLIENQESLQSLVTKGFYPTRGQDGELEILATNGEVTVDLQDGVQYILRFGSVAGISTDDGLDGEDTTATEDSETGAERYLLVTTRVNEAMIPRPAVQAVPQSLEELANMLNPAAAEPAPAEPTGEMQLNPLAPPANANPAADTPAPAGDAPNNEEPASGEPASEQSSGEDAADTEPEPAAPAETSGAGNTSATGEGGGSGAGQEPGAQPPAETPAAESPAAETEPQPAEQPAAEQSAQDTAPTTPANPWDDMTDEEKQEYLEAEQEKIKKENQRLLDEWTEQIEATRRRVRDLNARFADWYYVVPESTYTKLQFPVSDLIQAAGQETAPAAANPGLPQFNIPGLPGQP